MRIGLVKLAVAVTRQDLPACQCGCRACRRRPADGHARVDAERARQRTTAHEMAEPHLGSGGGTEQDAQRRDSHAIRRVLVLKTRLRTAPTTWATWPSVIPAESG